MPSDPSIPQWFQTLYDTGAQVAFQRQGSLLAPSVRWKRNVKGITAEFKKYGKGRATQKERNGNVVYMGIDHDKVSATLEDRFGPEPIDKLDELLYEPSERQLAINAGAMALGRSLDEEFIIPQLASFTTSIGDGSTDMTKELGLDISQAFNELDIPATDRWCIVPASSWTGLLNIAEFTNSQYVTDLPYQNGATVKNWLGIKWMMHNALTGGGFAYAYHMTAVGAASGADITSEFNYIPEKVMWLVNSMMKMGAICIDTLGGMKIPLTETSVL